ncbi:Macrocin-O-methyltransferase (TylF) [Seminavis robusta]|uniref:Macrocin-O-methyltransferase (TylF) n=1 Tax=Seminavis robusta TaxID=568900 RepID=A0A9N8ESR4_9STRA|nr:Macrocin-O-methyltransferase (TylF) [Seminavis robusta]|eukprot:Sro1487_g276790.1 Macrocin-O-methyltransferase (TylF) (374) ;mRNA; f:18088-19209
MASRRRKAAKGNAQEMCGCRQDMYRLITTALVLIGCTLSFLTWKPLITTCIPNTSTTITTGISSTSTGTTRNSLCMEVGDSNHRTRPLPTDTDRCLLFEPPPPSLQLLMNVLRGLPNAGRCDYGNPNCAPPYLPYDKKLRHFGDDWPPHGFTMTGQERLHNFYAAISEVNRNQIEGAIAEFGVWRGGAMMLAMAMTDTDTGSLIEQQQRYRGIPRDLYLFDAFGSFGGYGRNDNFLGVSLEDVKNNFRMLNLNPDQPRVHFVKGMFKDTTGAWIHRADPIAVLRVDGNFYSSYQDVMYAVYENVPVGGIVIFDDIYHPKHKSVMQFWNHFKADHGLVEELVRIDTGSAWFRKQKQVTVDQTKRRAVPTNEVLE